MRPPIPTTPLAPPNDKNILPFGTRVTVQHEGQSQDCWIQRCYQTKHGIEYEASTSGGERIKFLPHAILHQDNSATPSKIPDNYVVVDAGPHQHNQGGGFASGSATSMHPPRYNPYDAVDENSESSNDYDERQHQYEHRQQRGKSSYQRNHSNHHQLAHNAFIYPKGTVPQYIKEEKASELGKNFSGNLAAHHDPRAFYSHVRTVVLVHKVLLRAYKTITQADGLLEITPRNCENYSAASKVMARFLYIFFFHGRENMFDGNEYASQSLTTYEADQDGVAFLYDLIRDYQPNLRASVHRSNITDAFKLPEFHDTISVWEYINKMKIYFKEVNATAKQVDILRLIYDQLIRDPRFATAATKIQDKISEYKACNGFVPEEYTLSRIARTIMDMYDSSEREGLSQPRRRTIRQLELPLIDQIPHHESLSIQRMTTRTSPARPSGKPPLARYGPEQPSEDHNKNPPPAEICPSCMTYGHSADECTKTGAAITIQQFLKTCSPERKKMIVEAYKKNRQEAHERYVRAYKKRRQLKQQIRRLEYDHQYDTTTKEWKVLDDTASQKLDKLRIACVIAAKSETPDLDFGSLDDNYADIQEPQLEFDPAVDTFPDALHN